MYVALGTVRGGTVGVGLTMGGRGRVVSKAAAIEALKCAADAPAAARTDACGSVAAGPAPSRGGGLEWYRELEPPPPPPPPSPPVLLPSPPSTAVCNHARYSL